MSRTFQSSDLIQKIRDYQETHTELKKSHHFVFDCPLDKAHAGKPDFVWLGLNPGSDETDWQKWPSGPNMEETRDCDFQVKYGRSPGSEKRMKQLRQFLGNDLFSRTTHCELFFWCSPDTGESFKNRYGYGFAENPHWEFCCKMNKALISRLDPKAIFAESRRRLSHYEKRLGLTTRISHLDNPGDKNVLIEELRFDGRIPFYCFDHLSARISNVRRNQIKDNLDLLLHTAIDVHHHPGVI